MCIKQICNCLNLELKLKNYRAQHKNIFHIISEARDVEYRVKTQIDALQWKAYLFINCVEKGGKKIGLFFFKLMKDNSATKNLNFRDSAR